MYNTKEICFEDIKREVRKHHKVINRTLINNAYQFAEEKHKGKTRLTGEPYILHVIRVAYLIASWGFESDTICGALLHDTLEYTDTSYPVLENKFGKNIADMVNAVSTVNNYIRNKTTLTEKEINEDLSEEGQKVKMSDKALFIKMAERIDNLRTMTPFSEEKKFSKTRHTREVIIPMAKQEGAYQLIDILENLCLQLEHPERYAEIDSLYKAMREENKYTINKTLDHFKEVFSPNRSYNSREDCTILGSVVKFKYAPCSAISIYRQINSQANNLTTDLPKLLCKKNIPMYDLTLVISDDYCTKASNQDVKISPTDIFFKLYETFLIDKDITIVDFRNTSYGDSRYYILVDEMDNRYRLFVKSETEYMRYKLGRFIDFENTTDLESAIINGKKIKVYRRDKSAMYIDSEATYLDFAFAIHSEIGQHFKCAYTDGSKTQHKAYERVTEGDIITVETDPAIDPELQWFKYVKTNKSMNYLINYFSKTINFVSN